MATNQIKYGAIISYVALFVNVLIGLIYTPWVISTIGKADYGLYTLAMSIIGLLAFDFGLGNATTKFITQYLAEGRQDKVDNLLGLIFKLYLGVDVVIFLILIGMYFNLPNIYTGLTNDEVIRLSNVFFIAAGYCVLSFPFIPLSGILTSYEKFVQLKTCDLVHRLLIVATMSVCLLMGYGLYALVLVNSFAGIITILMKLAVVKRSTQAKVNIAFWSKAELKTIFYFVFWVTISSLAQRLIFNISPSILGRYADSQAIAVLGVAITLESYTFMFANALNGMFLPRVSRLMGNSDSSSEILGLMTKIGRIQIFIIGFICIWLISFGEHFIKTWVGNEYSLVYYCALLIILPSFLQLPQEIGLTYIVATNKVKLQSCIYCIMGLINVVISIPFTIYMGVVGMCLSIFIAYMIRTIGLDIIFQRVLKLDMSLFFRDSFLSLFPPLLLSLLLCMLINYLIPSEGWYMIIIKSVIALCIYSIIIYFMGMNEYEKNLFFYPIIKIIKR